MCDDFCLKSGKIDQKLKNLPKTQGKGSKKLNLAQIHFTTLHSPENRTKKPDLLSLK